MLASSSAEYVDELKEEIATLKAEREWISVKDRLPETSPWSYNTEMSRKVLVKGVGRYKYPWVAHLEFDTADNHFQWRNPYNLDPFEITHWMPLPAPPEVEGE